MTAIAKYYIFSFVAIIGVVILGYFTEQNEFPKICLGYGLMWSFYIFILQQGEQNPIRILILIAILLRCILIPSYPPLSDDFYRFIWDGFNNLDGINPYQFKPEIFIQENNVSPYKDIYPELNSTIYYSVYPPLLQGIFTLGTWISPNELMGSVITMRTSLILFEIGSIFFISRIIQQLRLPNWQVLIYALNPLAIVEISGNLHFEGMMIFFLTGSLYFLICQKRFIPSSICLGLAVGAKLLPLIFLPFFLHKLGFKKAFIYGLVTGSIAFLSFFMLWDIELLSHFRESVRLYYKSFEFNGGIYYIIREIGYLFRGYNEIATIGPGLALFSALGIISLALWDRNQHWERLPILFLLALSLYQLCSTTVHPWYIAPLVALASLTPFRYTIYWSGLILLTYINYSYEPYRENLWIVALEYTLVLSILIRELRMGYFQKYK